MELIRLNLLGRFEARLPSGEVRSLPTRKSEALLAYLALAPNQPHSRERLINLLWSDRGEEQARNSLRHALSALKKAMDGLESSPLQIERTSVSVNSQSIEVDALELQHLAKQKDPTALVQASTLYRGEFLEGMVIRDPACEEWLAAERARYRRMAVDVLANLLEHQRETGEIDVSIDTGERLVGLDPLRESAWRALMQAYAARGERNHALKVYKRCREVLANELGVEPEVQTTELDAAIRNGASNAEPSESQRDSTRASANRSSEASPAIPQLAPSSRPSVVVLPFVSLGTESEKDYFADGLTEDIIISLAHYRELFVIDQQSAFAFREHGVNAESFARGLSVNFLTKGSVRRSGSKIIISAQLIEVATGRTIWAERVDREFSDIFVVEGEVVGKIASSLVSHIEDTGRARAASKLPEDMTAFECVIRARRDALSYDAEENLAGRCGLEEAIALDPEYASAYAYLALSHLTEFDSPWCKSRKDALKRGVGLARKAVAMDEFDSNAQVAMGLGCLHQKKFELAEAHLDRAIECNPNHYNAYCIKSWLFAMTGRASEAMICGTTSFRLNPLAPDDCLWSFVVAHYVEKRYEEALGVLERMNDQNENTEAWRAACLAQLQRDDEAAAAAARTIELGGELIQHKDWLLSWPFKNQRDLERLLDGLYKAGVLSVPTGQSEASFMANEELSEVVDVASPSDKPSIVVLPFTNLSGDPGQEYFSDGITDDIVTNLSRFQDLFVIASESSFAYKGKAVNMKDVSQELGVRYILEGSVQCSNDQVRINAKLIDGSTGRHLWAERYERRLDDIFKMQDEVVEMIVGTLASGYGGRLRKAWQKRTRGTRPQNAQAFDCFMRGIDAVDEFTSESNRRGREFFEQAIELDPNYSKAYGKLAWTYLLDATEGWTDDYDGALKKGFEFATKGIESDDSESWAHWPLAAYYAYMARHDLAQSEFQKAVELNPNDADVLTDAGFYLSYAGKAEEGLEMARKAMRLNPHYPEYYTGQIVQIYFDGRQYEDAIVAYESLRRFETTLVCLYLAASHAALGHTGEARKAVERVLKLDREATIQKWTDLKMAPYKEPKDLEHFRENLRKAGLPK